MLTRIVQAVIVAVLAGLLLSGLLGPLLATLPGPVAVVGHFLAVWGWTLGLLAGLWFYFSGALIWRHPGGPHA